MKIGISYDLRSDYLKAGYSLEETAEFDKESTIEGIEEAIQANGHTTDRIGNVFHLIDRLKSGDRWDLVFNIAEGLYGEGRESLVPALLDAWQIPYVFSGPVTLGLSLNKALCKQIIRDSGLNTPAFQLIYTRKDLSSTELEFPLFAKPNAEGTGKGISAASLIRNEKELDRVVSGLLEQFKQPVLLEEFLPGREFTVGVIGSGKDARSPGAMEIIYKTHTHAIYSYENKENYEELVEYKAVQGPELEACHELALGAWKALHCLDGGRVDLKVDRHGNMSFIEVNPLAGLNPVSSDLPILCRLNGISYHQLIREILDSAIKRHFSQ